MHRRTFETRIKELLRGQVEGLDLNAKADLVRQHLDIFVEDADRAVFRAEFEPFIPGRRPVDEATWPGLGSSEQVALYNLAGEPEDTIIFLVRFYEGAQLVPRWPENAQIFGSIQPLDPLGQPLGTVVGWDRRELKPLLRQIVTVEGASTRIPAAHALQLNVEKIFSPESMPIPAERYLGFASLFHQRFLIHLDVEVGGLRVAGGSHDFEIHNVEQFGSLYQRIVDVLLPRDVEHQAGANRTTVPISAHPWYPVLSIGMQKATFYMDAITGDLVEQKKMLSDPGWLLRVGLYLELLTCLGIAEAVKDEIDFLTPNERDLFENDPAWAEIRSRIDVSAWKKVWALRQISFGNGAASAALNLKRKKDATLGFLHAHHEDLKHAVELAGPNLRNSQESWHRVFRDAERATLQMNADAFPELAHFPDIVRNFALWHQSGGLGGIRLLPRTITELFGDQDGIFPSACRQYRASMNYIAAWGRERGLMEYTGPECVPESASLFEAYLGKRPGRMASLQRRDGFAGTLDVVVREAESTDLEHEAVVASLQTIDIFSVLDTEELHELARGVRPIHLGHLERILRQGEKGSSLFILHDGVLEVTVRDGDGERQLALLQPPAVVGELAFLIGEPRGATVRVIDNATVLEVNARLLRSLIAERPVILEKLQRLIEERRKQKNISRRGTDSLMSQLRRTIFGDSER